MMRWTHDGWGAGDWLAMSFVMVVLWGLLVALVVWLRDRDRGGASTAQRGQAGHADEVLAERFASGEIDEAEFTRSRALLHNSGMHS